MSSQSSRCFFNELVEKLDDKLGSANEWVVALRKIQVMGLHKSTSKNVESNPRFDAVGDCGELLALIRDDNMPPFYLCNEDHRKDVFDKMQRLAQSEASTSLDHLVTALVEADNLEWAAYVEKADLEKAEGSFLLPPERDGGLKFGGFV